MHKKILFLSFSILVSVAAFAQPKTPAPPKQDNRALIQFSGMIVESDSLFPIPYTAIMIANTRRGTVSDYYGYFSFVAQVKDTIEFSAVGFKKIKFVIPDTLTTNRYSLIQVMSIDTIFLQEVKIYPWPTPAQFKEAFLALNIPDDDLAHAQKNLNKDLMALQYANMGNDANGAYKSSLQQQYSKLYYGGQTPPNNLLNPVAWAKFIQAWRSGAYRKKEETTVPKQNPNPNYQYVPKQDKPKAPTNTGDKG